MHCGRKRIARLMRRANLRGVCRRRRAHTTRRDQLAQLSDDLVQRQFTASQPDALWCADITYLPTWQGFLYLAVIIDAYSRRVVGWSMANHLRMELVLDALEMALCNRKPGAGLIHHADHGSQYTSLAFGRRCRQAGITPSMGSVGDCFDNAMAESFFASLECELIDRSRWCTHTEARMAVFDYIEAFYNPRRRHSAIAYLSPAEFERRTFHQATAPSHPPSTKAGELQIAVATTLLSMRSLRPRVTFKLRANSVTRSSSRCIVSGCSRFDYRSNVMWCGTGSNPIGRTGVAPGCRRRSARSERSSRRTGAAPPAAAGSLRPVSMAHPSRSYAVGRDSDRL